MINGDQIYAFSDTAGHGGFYSSPAVSSERNKSCDVGASVKQWSSRVIGGENIILLHSQARYGVKYVSKVITTLGLMALTSGAASEVSIVEQPSAIAGALDKINVTKLMPMHFEESWREMSSYKELVNGWDGVGSLAPREGVIKAALSFLKILPHEFKAPEGMASSDGTAGWFWGTEKIYASIEFLSANKYTYFARTRDKTKSVQGHSVFDGKSIPADLLKVIELA